MLEKECSLKPRIAQVGSLIFYVCHGCGGWIPANPTPKLFCDLCSRHPSPRRGPMCDCEG
jgi:rRNA maturation endonuclease Nob1